MVELTSNGLDADVTPVKREDKQAICKALLPVLQMTRNLWDLVELEYDDKAEQVTAHFASGFSKKANVAMDSGTAMIKDILKQIL